MRIIKISSISVMSNLHNATSLVGLFQNVSQSVRKNVIKVAMTMIWKTVIAMIVQRKNAKNSYLQMMIIWKMNLWEMVIAMIVQRKNAKSS